MKDAGQEHNKDGQHQSLPLPIAPPESILRLLSLQGPLSSESFGQPLPPGIVAIMTHDFQISTDYESFIVDTTSVANSANTAAHALLQVSHKT